MTGDKYVPTIEVHDPATKLFSFAANTVPRFFPAAVVQLADGLIIAGDSATKDVVLLTETPSGVSALSLGPADGHAYGFGAARGVDKQGAACVVLFGGYELGSSSTAISRLCGSVHGEPCTSGAQCMSGVCADGVCSPAPAAAPAWLAQQPSQGSLTACARR